MKGNAATITVMSANTQNLFNSDSAGGAVLRCVRSIHFDQPSPGTFSLVRQFVNERTPTRVRYLFRKRTPDHPGNVKFFDRNQVVMSDQVSRKFVLKIASLVSDFVVDTPEHRGCFTPSIRPFLSPGDFARCNSKFLLSGFVVSPVIYLRSIGEGCERFDANIDADRRPGRLKDLFWHIIARNDCIPFCSFTLRDNFLYLSFDRSRKFDLEVTNEGKIQFAISEAVTSSVVDDRVKECLPFEAWVAWFLSGLDTAKERLECLIYFSDSLADCPLRNCLIVGVQDVSNLGNLVYLIEAGDANTVQVPSVSTFLQGGIVKITEKIKGIFEALLLNLRGVDSVLIGKPHKLIIA